MLCFRISGMQITIVFEVSWYCPAGRLENLSGNFRLPILISTPAVPMKFIYFIFNLFNVDNYTPFLTFGNKTSFPRRVTTTSNL